MPIATALFVATCLGTPAIALTGLKLGMFAAVGGGIMGFATGKMFAEHELVDLLSSVREMKLVKPVEITIVTRSISHSVTSWWWWWCYAVTDFDSVFWLIFGVV